jgi:tyrosine-protein kinase Etk/Wzc
MQTQEIRLQDYIGVVYRKKWTVILSFVMVLGISLYYAISTPPVFISSATVKIDTRTLNTRGDGAVVQTSVQPVEYYDRIFKTGIFKKEVLDTLSADMGIWVIAQRENVLLADLVEHNLKLETDEVQTFFRITATASHPELAYRLAQVSSQLFQKRLIEIESESMRDTDNYLDEQLNKIRTRLEETEIQIQNFAREHGLVPNLDTSNKKGAQDFLSIQFRLEELELTRELTQTKLRRYYQRREEILNQAPIKTPGSNFDATLKEIRVIAAEMDSLEALRGNLTRKLGQTDERVIAINKQLRDLKARQDEINTQVKVSAPTNDSNLLPLLQTKIVEAEQALFELSTDAEYYEQKIREFAADNSDIINHELELQRLLRSKELFETSYNSLIQFSEEQQFRRATQSGGVKMIDPANRPTAPMPSTVPKKVLFGAILGLSLGLGAAFLLEYMDTSLKSSEDVTRFLSIPLIGEIPKIKDEAAAASLLMGFLPWKTVKREETYNARLITNFSPKEPIPEAYRNVRTSLQFTFVDDPLRCFVISSPNASEGKSLTTSNLAIGFAQAGKKTVIIDTDLRRPVIHKIFGLTKEPGITDVLANHVSLRSALQPTGIDGLFILPAGQSTPNPGELIGSHRMDEVLNELKQEMDVVLLDSPPVIAAIDAAILGAKTQGILLVFNMDETKREAAKYCIEQIERAGSKVIGGLLNNIDVDRRYGYYYSYRYYYRYKYYSKYYYGYGDDERKKA